MKYTVSIGIFGRMTNSRMFFSALDVHWLSIRPLSVVMSFIHSIFDEISNRKELIQILGDVMLLYKVIRKIGIDHISFLITIRKDIFVIFI